MITDIFQNCLILQGGIEMFEGVTKERGKSKEKSYRNFKENSFRPNPTLHKFQKNVITLTYIL